MRFTLFALLTTTAVLDGVKGREIHVFNYGEAGASPQKNGAQEGAVSGTIDLDEVWYPVPLYAGEGQCRCSSISISDLDMNPKVYYGTDDFYVSEQECLYQYSQLPYEFCSFEGSALFKDALVDRVISLTNDHTVEYCKGLYRAQNIGKFLASDCTVIGSLRHQLQTQRIAEQTTRLVHSADHETHGPDELALDDHTDSWADETTQQKIKQPASECEPECQ
ncbi:hypothetical protein GNI_130010, partial [Gregarina niphandrodes]